MIEAELTDTFGAARHAATLALRDGHRTRTLTATAGDLELRIPKLRTGSLPPVGTDAVRPWQAVRRADASDVRPRGTGQNLG